MTQSKSKIWIHAFWTTKDLVPLINQTKEEIIYNYITSQFKELKCPVKIINGTEDHIHCLFLLHREISLSQLIKQIKGSSSHFINQKNIIEEKFSWQNAYIAYSVSESTVDKVTAYIKNQKTLHQTKTFEQEYNEFLEIFVM
jgi:putative transposase